MDEGAEQYRRVSLSYCDKLLAEVKQNQEDAELFFGGDLYKAYADATEQAEKKIKKIRTRIRNL